jgi:hypothetical protein
MTYYQNKGALKVDGYEIYFTRFADSILVGHFPDAKKDLEEILDQFFIPEADVIKGGGGKSVITQSLAKLLEGKHWNKEIIETSLTIGKFGDDRSKVLPSKSHEVDHYKVFSEGTIGLEIEWNNKDPFYDRDLENFRKIHQIGELSLGIIITRGASLQMELLFVIERSLEKLERFDREGVIDLVRSSDNAKELLDKLIKLPKDQAIKAIAKAIYNSKFGAATTHMSKLLTRLDRGVGDPCPFILIGIGKERLRDQTAVS